MQNHEILTRIKQILPRVQGVKYLLYGSRARGDNREDSDVDILVLLPEKFNGKQYLDTQMEINEKLYTLELEWNMEIQIAPLILRNSEFWKRETPFTRNVINEGIEI